MKAVIIFVGLVCVVQVDCGLMDMIAEIKQMLLDNVQPDDIRNEIQLTYDVDLFRSSATTQNVCKKICRANQEGDECQICKWLLGEVDVPNLRGVTKTRKRNGAESTDASVDEGKYISFNDGNTRGKEALHDGWGEEGGTQISFGGAGSRDEEERKHKEANMNFDNTGSSRRAKSSTGVDGHKKTYLPVDNANTRTTEAVDAGWGLQGGTQISFGGAGSGDEGTVLHFAQQHPQMANMDATAAQNRALRQEIEKHLRSKNHGKP